MAAIATIKTSSMLLDAAGLLAGTSPLIKSLSATIGVDVSVAGSPGNLDPEGFIPNGIAKWVDRSSPYQISYPSFTLSSKAPTKTSRVTRVQTKFSQPILEITSASTYNGIAPSPTVAYTAIWNSEFVIPERMTQAERVAFFSKCLSFMVAKINASDDVPTDLTGSPLPSAVINLDKPY